jgi:acyl-CoA synthetase (AMP-forming)/AMP-acid ligase II
MVVRGVSRRPQGTAEKIDANGWLHHRAISGQSTATESAITDRLEDTFICGGFIVYPAEVKHVLRGIQGVAEADVVYVPDERPGEVGCAYLTLLDRSFRDEKSVDDECRQKLADSRSAIGCHPRGVPPMPRARSEKRQLR